MTATTPSLVERMNAYVQRKQETERVARHKDPRPNLKATICMGHYPIGTSPDTLMKDLAGVLASMMAENGAQGCTIFDIDARVSHARPSDRCFEYAVQLSPDPGGITLSDTAQAQLATLYEESVTPHGKDDAA